MSYFPKWQTKTSGVIAPDEALPASQTIALGIQHVVAMFGSTILAPILMGFDPNVAVLMSGIGTLIFFLVVGGRIPSYLGSSFAFIGVVIAATGYVAGSGLNPNISVALGGILTCGLVYFLIGLVVQAVGVNWIEKLMPPVVTGAVVAVIGLNLAPTACKSIGQTNFDAWIAILSVLCVGGVAVYTRGFAQKLLILIGLSIAYVIYAVLANGFGLGKPIDFSIISDAAWFGVPNFQHPVFRSDAILLIVPVVIILVAENLGHVKAVTAMTGRNLDPYMGRAFMGDGLATMISASVGGTGVTTYGENIGVMAATRVYSTLLFPVAAAIAILLGFSPKFGALIHTIPQPILAGMSIVVFGLIAIAGARIWVENHVDFSNNRNLIVAAVTLILGGGDFTLSLGGFTMGGIGTATFGAIILNAIMSLGEKKSRR
ncbi:NCS2 family nucleobase:cation symporter [Mesosutterella sp. OilRF-GAM-744-9]|uniref:NCS2 family nucleobase:cation symporter n=1 Tax=Mesosutterella porci TaxID=2915351 RepID=A0ABS9MRA5_9BURK|nr:solute carrier family 23 protein [Mesosutterella sp. oilRF-744-WT-GAM-9]MCG5031165.1 NCS2 family nucleobase:cation symporter [Mesosutterella sp. oilRF-744-WT-GAM-9]MCI6530359.1 NCS2 family nucleobase:cation symporter [Mesosutterella sp.]